MISNATRIQLASEALKVSSALRKRFGYDLSSPINIFDLCDKSEVPVRFVDINMEGMYVQMGEGIKPTILISAYRPFHRKIFTGAHEYGHHVFEHGFSLDQITTSRGEYTKEEFLVDTFAGYLLMPPLGLKGSFIKRKIDIKTVTPLDCFTIASSFGVGYSTLINHLQFNAHIGQEKANTLLRNTPKSIKASIIGAAYTGSLFIIDKHFSGKTIDVETTGHIVLPKDVKVEDDQYLKQCKEIDTGVLYQAHISGLTRIFSPGRDWSCFVRIQKYQYAGLSKYRHLSD